MVNHTLAAKNASAVERATDLSTELSSNEQTLLANDYPQDRGIFKRGAIDNLNHIDFFGAPYLQFLRSLSQDDLFVHVGPGDFHAEVDYFSSPEFTPQANVLSNAYAQSNTPEALENMAFLKEFEDRGKFKCISGIKFQDLKIPLKGKAKLIADVFAAGSYDENVFGVFEAASEILVPGGMYAVVLASVNFESITGAPIPAAEIYKNIGGFELVHQTKNDGWVFRRTEDAFVAPKAETISFVARDRNKGIFWPVRHYRIG